MQEEREAVLRERAHAIWQREGEPHGRHEEHWHQAVRELDQESQAEPATDTPGTSVKRASKPRRAPVAIEQIALEQTGVESKDVVSAAAPAKRPRAPKGKKLA